MARFGKWEVMETIMGTGFIPVFYHPRILTAEKALNACYKAGVRLFEFTNRGDFAHDVFASLEKFAAEKCPGLILGAGTISDPATAALFIQMGANFIVGPNFNPAVAALCNRRLVPYIQGCATVTEAGNAQEARCDICKLFPADQLGGPSFVKA